MTCQQAQLSFPARALVEGGQDGILNLDLAGPQAIFPEKLTPSGDLKKIVSARRE